MSKQVPIAIADLLGAILAAAPKKRKVTFKDDEGADIKSVEELPLISIDTRPDGLICTLPMSEILSYMKEPHLMQFQVVGQEGLEETAIITFEKQSLLGEVLAANGSKALPSNNLMSRFLAELNGLKVDDRANQDPQL